MGRQMQDIERILSFWFEECSEKQWFGKDSDFDAAIRERFGAQVDAAMAGELDHWCESADGTLAYLLLLDQFTRNIFRGSGKAFAADGKARTACKRALEAGFDAALDSRRKTFLYLPLEHSEDLADQSRCVALFEALGDAEKTDYAIRHRDIIQRFGRFPHRNEALGRQSTDEELAFLKEPGSSF
ncbi:DUF924 domain-containing protein [Nisaea acidiphila]|uniref:DUF924 domain-containing protein n=1 Tax=Nisaea acidiphila TaxID=1862145 RepID=A0A9J7ATB6_9PROT|nr:DUF924 family protein [Nisaea acidiphila]UUX49572.1 DUF924 domain-containing protein [Nisaea acidiphila]